MYQALLKKNKGVVERLQNVETDYRAAREKWVGRESEYRFQIQDLLKAGQGDDSRKKHWRMDQISEMHGCIMDNISSLQSKTTEVLQEQERDLHRSFKSRIDSLVKKLEDKSKPADETMQWITKCHDLKTELNWIKDMTTKMQADLQKEKDRSRKLQIAHDNLEADREFLIKSLLAVKKENQRLRREFEDVPGYRRLESSKGSRSALTSPERLGRSPSARSLRSEPAPRPQSAQVARSPGRELQRPASAVVIATNSAKLAENRYAKTLTTLRKKLDQERKKRNALDIKLNHTQAERNELQMFLKQCLGDVKDEIQANRRGWGGGEAPLSARQTRGKARVLSGPHSARRRSARPVLGSEERARVLELLFARERVLELLYSQAFPNAPGTQSMSRPSSNLFVNIGSPRSIKGGSPRSSGFFQDSGRPPISPLASPISRYGPNRSRE